jgi:ATP-dependent Zn protease
MAGRVAEELIFGADQISTGASSDFQQATELATRMVTKFGMSDKVGHILISDDDSKRLSQDTRNIIDAEVHAILESAYARAVRLLREREQELHRLATALLERETLSSEDVAAVIEGRSLNAL